MTGKRMVIVALAGLAVVALSGCIRFAAPESLPVSGGTRLADVNGDGKADVLADDGTGLARFVYCGTGCVQPKEKFSGQHLRQVADFNGDGIVDVLTHDGTTYRVLFGGSSGLGNAATFAAAPDNPGLADVGDFNGDGKADLVRSGSLAPGFGRFVVYLGDGLGGFTASTLSVVYPEGESGPVQLLVGDVDGNHRDDLLVAAVGQIGVFRYGDPSTCTFGATCAYFFAAMGGNQFALGDVNGDGKADLARYTFGTPGTVDFFRSTGSGFTKFPAYQTISVPVSGKTLQMGLRDVDGDGKVDFLMNDLVDTRTWWSGTGDGGFPYQARTDVPLTVSGCPSCLGDVDGDGRLDAADAGQIWFNTSD